MQQRVVRIPLEKGKSDFYKRGNLRCCCSSRRGQKGAENCQTCISERPQEAEQVSGAAGLQDQGRGLSLGLTEQHLHHVLVSAHCGVEEDPVHKLLRFRRLAAVCSRGQQAANDLVNLNSGSRKIFLRVYVSSRTSEGFDHHSRGRPIPVLQLTFADGAVVTFLPQLQPLKHTLLRDFPGAQERLGL